jgi:hypothetical protein
MHGLLGTLALYVNVSQSLVNKTIMNVQFIVPLLALYTTVTRSVHSPGINYKSVQSFDCE